MVKPELDGKVDYYSLLDVSYRAEKAEIRKQFLKLGALKYHPDKNPSPSASHQFQLLTNASEVLSDPVKRATYDRIRGVSARMYTNHSTMFKTTPPGRTTTGNGQPRTPKSANATAGWSGVSPRRSGGTNYARRTGMGMGGGGGGFGFFGANGMPGGKGSKGTAGDDIPGVGARRAGMGGPSPFRPHTPGQKSAAEETPGKRFFRRFDQTSPFSETETPMQRATRLRKEREANQRQQRGKKPPSPIHGNKAGTTEKKFGATFTDSDNESSTSDDANNDDYWNNLQTPPRRPVGSNMGGSFRWGQRDQKKSDIGSDLGNGWARKSTAYSHVYQGRKEDLRSPLMTNSNATNEMDGSSQDEKSGEHARQQSPTTSLSPKTPEPLATDGNGYYGRQDEQHGKSSETSPLKEGEYERRFATPFSKLSDNVEGRKLPKPKEPEPFDIEGWRKKFEAMDPFGPPPVTGALPRQGSPRKTLPRKVGRKVGPGSGDWADLSNLKRDLPTVSSSVNQEEVPSLEKLGATFMGIPIPVFPKNQRPPPIPAFVLSSTAQSKQPSTLDTLARDLKNVEPLSHPVIPALDPPHPPKRLVPNSAKPLDFSFSVPPQAEMKMLLKEVQSYHVAYSAEKTRFEKQWSEYERSINMGNINEVENYLKVKKDLESGWKGMEDVHGLVLGRWREVAKFSGFEG